MLSSRIRRFLRLRQIFSGLAGLGFGLLLSVLSNWLSEKWIGLLPWIAGVAVLMGLISLILSLREPFDIDVAIRSPLTIRSPHEAKLYARRGFVGFVPLYTPKPDTEAEKLSPEERLEAARALDFDRLQIEESNLWPTIQAILAHSSQLEHCWLLATRGRSVPGSLPYAKVLAEYLRQRGMKCKFHYGDDYVIPLDDDALVLSKTFQQVRRVFREAIKLGIPPRDMVADITTGVRSMTLGMVLACLNGDQDIEFVGTHYNEMGRPVGDLFPLIFSFEPILREG